MNAFDDLSRQRAAYLEEHYDEVGGICARLAEFGILGHEDGEYHLTPFGLDALLVLNGLSEVAENFYAPES